MSVAIYGAQSLYGALDFKYTVNRRTNIIHIAHEISATQDRGIDKIGKGITSNEGIIYANQKSTICGMNFISNTYFRAYNHIPVSPARLCKTCVAQLPKKRLETT